MKSKSNVASSMKRYEINRGPVTVSPTRPFIYLFMMLCLSFGSLVSAQPLPSANGSSSFSIRALKDTFETGSHITIIASTTNMSEDPAGMLPNIYRFYIRDGNGNLINERSAALGQLTDPHRALMEKVPSGETKKRVFVISDIYDISKPGQYSIQAERLISSNSQPIVSNIINITVFDKSTTAFAQDINLPTTEVTLEIDSEKDIVQSGSAINVRIETTNNSIQSLDIDNSPTMYIIKVRDSQGVAAPLTPDGEKLTSLLGKGSGPRVHLQPGETKGTSVIDISKFYEMIRSGQYTVEISMLDQAKKQLATSNLITVTVIP